MDQISRLLQETVLFLAAIARAAGKSVRDNSGLAVLSVVLAFGLWIFITGADNEVRTRVLPVDITVEPMNVPPDVAVADPLDPVRLRIRVSDDVFETLTAADFVATVDLDGLTVGEYELPVQVRPLTSRGGLRVEEVLPSTTQVRLAQLTTKSVDVVVDVDGEVPPGFSMGLPQPSDATVLVSGPQERVDAVTQAFAVIDVDGRTEPVDQAVRLTPRDARGFLVQGVTLDPPITDVSIDIEQRQFSRTVAVDPVLTGEPADGYNVVSVSVNPSSVTVHGSRAFIEGAVTIQTRPVEITRASDDVIRTVSLAVPSGASVTGGVPVVTVTVRIEPALGLVSFGVPVSASNLAGDLSISGSLPSVQVTLYGPLPILRDMTPADIAVIADLANRNEGTHTITPRITVPEELEVRSVSPEQIEIVLERS